PSFDLSARGIPTIQIHLPSTCALLRISIAREKKSVAVRTPLWIAIVFAVVIAAARDDAPIRLDQYGLASVWHLLNRGDESHRVCMWRQVDIANALHDEDHNQDRHDGNCADDSAFYQ